MLSELSESFEVDGWVASPGVFYFKNAIRREMPLKQSTQLTLTNASKRDFCKQPATFDNPGINHTTVTLITW